MKSTRLATLCLALGLASVLSPNIRAEVFNDATGEITNTISNAGGTLDFVRMEVTDNASDVLFVLTVNGNVATTDWGNFMVGIATTKTAGATNGNGWSRPIRMNVVTNGVTNGMTHWIGSWVSGGGGSQLWTFGTTNWQGPAALAGFSFSPGVQSTISYTISKTSLGVTTGDTLYFDAYSSGGGGGDSAVDALANPAASIATWGQTYISSNTNNTVKSYTLSYNVADSDGDGLPDAWETEKFGNLGQAGTDDPDVDSSANAQEYAAGTNPLVADSDSDGLNDGVETNTGNFVSATNTGSNPLDADTDNDGSNDGAEVATGTNPNKTNFSQITVAILKGWTPEPVTNNANVMNRVGGDEFGWELKTSFTSTSNNVAKFATGSWSQNWGASGTPGVAQPGGYGNDIPLNPSATGIWRIYFNTDTLSYTFTRAAAPATYADWAAQYGLVAGSESEDGDVDGLSNQQEFTLNLDPTNDDTDGDGLTDGDETAGTTSGNYFFDINFNSVPIATNPLLADTDGDGLRDRWEILNTLDPTDNGTDSPYENFTGLAGLLGNPNGGTSDPDGDSLTNLQEQSAGSNPLAIGTGFASTYAKVVVAGSFVRTKPDGTWDEVGNPMNTMQLVGNFTWKLVAYLPAVTNYASFKLTTGSWSTNFGDNVPLNGAPDGVGDANGTDISALPVFTAPGYYLITFNDFTKAYTLAPLAATDADTDGLPDDWEEYYGGFRDPKLTNLDPGTVYVAGSNITAAQAYAAGIHPTLDTTAPTLGLAAGIEKLSWVAKNGSVTLASADVIASDDITSSPVVTLNPATVDTATDGLTTVTYTATDAAGNATTLTRVIAVGDAEPGWRKLHYPKTTSISTLGTATVYGRIYIAGATPGAGQAPNVTAELGVHTADSDPSSWTGAGVWRPAIHNPGFADGDDEFIGTIQGADLAAGTYYYAYRFKIGSGAWVYAGINAGGTAGGPWNAATGGANGNGVLTVTTAVTREATFAVDMRVQQFKGSFVAGEKLVVSGAFNGWGTNNELTLDAGSGLHKATLLFEGAAGATNTYKFRILGPTRTNEAMQYETSSDRSLVLGEPNSTTNLSTVFFNDLGESRKITFRVDMSVQATKGTFNTNTGVVYVAGSFNGWNTSATPLAAQGNGIYAAEVTVDGSLSLVAYKFLKGTTVDDYEQVSDRTITAVLPNLQASALDPVLFNNDDGIGPVITLTGDSPINLNVGDLFTDPGATASDAIDGAVTVNTTGTVNTAVANTYTLTYTASDAAGNAAAPVNRTVVVAPSAGSTFAGAYSGKDLTNQAANGLTYLVNYAFGGSDTSNPKLPALDTSDPANLMLVAYVRTNNTVGTLGVVAERADALTDWDTNNPISGTPALDQTGAPAGTQKQIFSTPKSGNRQFLRLRTTLAP